MSIVGYQKQDISFGMDTETFKQYPVLFGSQILDFTIHKEI